MNFRNISYVILFVLAAGLMYFYIKPLIPFDMTKKIDKILVIKHKRKLLLLSGNEVVRTYRIALGRNPKGHKQYKGDMRTPEGNYSITDKNPNSNFYKNLGISYPNQKDIAYAKSIDKSPGGQIKIHGLKNGYGWIGRFHLLRNWTRGCIAVTNNEMDEIYGLVEIGTPIIIKP